MSEYWRKGSITRIPTIRSVLESYFSWLAKLAIPTNKMESYFCWPRISMLLIGWFLSKMSAHPLITIMNGGPCLLVSSNSRMVDKTSCFVWPSHLRQWDTMHRIALNHHLLHQLSSAQFQPVGNSIFSYSKYILLEKGFWCLMPTLDRSEAPCHLRVQVLAILYRTWSDRLIRSVACASADDSGDDGPKQEDNKYSWTSSLDFLHIPDPYYCSCTSYWNKERMWTEPAVSENSLMSLLTTFWQNHLSRLIRFMTCASANDGVGMTSVQTIRQNRWRMMINVVSACRRRHAVDGKVEITDRHASHIGDVPQSDCPQRSPLV